MRICGWIRNNEIFHFSFQRLNQAVEKELGENQVKVRIHMLELLGRKGEGERLIHELKTSSKQNL